MATATTEIYTLSLHAALPISAGRYLEEGAELVLAVTPYVDDESPVYVSRRGDGDVRAVSDEPVVPVCVTGGAYGLSAAARLAVAGARAPRGAQNPGFPQGRGGGGRGGGAGRGVRTGGGV